MDLCLILLHKRRGDKDTPSRDVDRGDQSQGDFAVDSSAGIPASSVFTRVRMHGEHIRFSKLCRIGRINEKRVVAIDPGTDFLAIEIDFRAGHHPIKKQLHALALRCGRQLELFAIPTLAAPRQLAGAATLIQSAERAGNGPVVGQIDMFPLGIVKVRSNGRLLIAFGKLPAEAEVIDCRCGNME